ncbi:MAG: proteasome assembly chaperone family protein [Euryarchaeota archaeon]|nr:proteasome assembly chaperone family protein [Euryarchaeota archaeon]
MKTTIIEIEKIKPNNPIFIEGLPGIGLIGKIATEYLVSELKAKKFAELYSPYFPHQALIGEDSSLRLVRDEFHYSKEKDIIFLTGDTQVSPTNSYGHYQIVHKILDFLEKYGVTKIYTLGGYSAKETEIEDPKVLASSTDHSTMEQFSDADTHLIFRKDMGAAIVGAAGLLPTMGKMRNLEGVCLLGESSGDIIDPKAAKSVLKCLNKMLKTDIDLEGLEKKIEENKEIIKNLRRYQEKTEKEIKEKQRKRDMEYIR